MGAVPQGRPRLRSTLSLSLGLSRLSRSRLLLLNSTLLSGSMLFLLNSELLSGIEFFLLNRLFLLKRPETSSSRSNTNPRLGLRLSRSKLFLLLLVVCLLCLGLPLVPPCVAWSTALADSDVPRHVEQGARDADWDGAAHVERGAGDAGSDGAGHVAGGAEDADSDGATHVERGAGDADWDGAAHVGGGARDADWATVAAAGGYWGEGGEEEAPEEWAGEAMASSQDAWANRSLAQAARGSHGVMRMLGESAAESPWALKACANGTVRDASGKCVRGWQIDYCRAKWDGTFVKTSYNYFGRNRLVRLGRADAILPNRWEYAMNGNCQKIVDSACHVVKGFICQSCCYISRARIALRQVPCFNNPLKMCNPTFSQFTATCGMPPRGVASTTICSVCVK